MNRLTLIISLCVTIIIAVIGAALFMSKNKEPEVLDYPAKIADRIITDDDYKRLAAIELRNIAHQQYIRQGFIIDFDQPDFIKCKQQIISKVDKTLTEVDAKTFCKETYNSAKASAFSNRINNIWLDLEGQRKKISPTIKDLESLVKTSEKIYQKSFDEETKVIKENIKNKTKQKQALKRLSKSKKEFPTAAAYQEYLGFTKEDILLPLRAQFVASEIRKRQGVEKTLTAKEIKTYFDKHKESRRTPKQFSIFALTTESLDKANDALEEIQDEGKPFKKIFAKYNTDGGLVKQKGNIKKIDVSQVETEPEFAKSLSQAKLKKWHGPLTLSTGFLIYYPYQITGGKLPVFNQQVKKQVAAEIFKDRENKYLLSLSKQWKDKTICRESMALAQCSNFEEPVDVISTKTGDFTVK